MPELHDDDREFSVRRADISTEKSHQCERCGEYFNTGWLDPELIVTDVCPFCSTNDEVKMFVKANL